MRVLASMVEALTPKCPNCGGNLEPLFEIGTFEFADEWRCRGCPPGKNRHTSGALAAREGKSEVSGERNRQVALSRGSGQRAW